MTEFEPFVALTTSEQALRQLVKSVLINRDGGAWLTDNFSDDQIAKWKAKQEEEVRTRGRRGHASTSTEPLDFSELYELSALLLKQWDRGFSSVFDGIKRAEVETLLTRLERLRLAVAHSRELLPFERDLLSGIAGDIRNRVTIYLSSQSASGDFYPRIERVVDSFGNSTSFDAAPDTGHAMIRTKLALKVGDQVTFDCVATDPHGRSLTWWWLCGGRRSENVEGAQVRLKWLVAVDDIADDAQMLIQMKVKDAEWHRLGQLGTDSSVLFRYQVLPPQIMKS